MRDLGLFMPVQRSSHFMLTNKSFQFDLFCKTDSQLRQLITKVRRREAFYKNTTHFKI